MAEFAFVFFLEETVRMNRTTVIGIFTVLLSAFAIAQAPQQTAAPGITPQHQALGNFAGD